LSPEGLAQGTQPSGKRTLKYEQNSSALEQELNAQIKTAWDRFEHCNCSLLAYVSPAYPEGKPHLFNSCLRKIDTFQQDLSTISNSADKSLDAMTRLSSESPLPSSFGPLILPVVLTTFQQRLLVLFPAKLKILREPVL